MVELYPDRRIIYNLAKGGVGEALFGHRPECRRELERPWVQKTL